MLANLLHVAGVKHVITVDLHASQMQGFFRCPVDNLHAEPLIARWIRRNVLGWREGVVVSKNAGGTKRVTSLADALKLNFGMVTTDRKRGGDMTASMIMNHLDGVERQPALENHPGESSSPEGEKGKETEVKLPIRRAPIADSHGSPRSKSSYTNSPLSAATPVGSTYGNDDAGYDDSRPLEVTRGRLIQGHLVEDDFPSTSSNREDQTDDEDPMTMSHQSSFFSPEKQRLGGSAEAEADSDEEENVFQNPKAPEHMITLVGDVKDRPVFIVDDMIDKPGSWIAAAETVVKRGRAKKVYCIATHGVFGGDCLEKLQACSCIDAIVVTNSFPLSQERVKNISKLVILDVSILLSEAIRRNHYGESISPLFQHTD